MNPQTKPIFKSKTLLVNAVVAIAAFYPPVGTWVQAHPTETMLGLAVLNSVLRLVTHGKLSLTGDE